MRKGKSLLKRLWDAMNDSRFEKPLLIALPIVSLMLAAAILLPQIRAIVRHVSQEEQQAEDTVQAIIVGIETPPPDAPSDPPPLEAAAVTEPTQTPADRESEPVAYVPIQNIEDVVEIVDVSQMSPEEIKPGNTETAPEETVAEVISTEEILSEAAMITIQEPARDEAGNQLYRYYFNVGPNGFLLYRESREESNVLPIDEDGDGVPEYGIYYVSEEILAETENPQTITEEPASQSAQDESGQGEEGPENSESTVDGGADETPVPQTVTRTYTVSVELFHSDNTPVETYDIVATPIMTASSVSAGWLQRDGRTYYYEADGSMAVGLKLIDGRVYYFNEYGVKASSVGIDVSFYNEDINWTSVKAHGIDFAIIRVGGRGWSSGTLYDDIRTQEYLRGARAAGLKVGVYFYSTAINAREAIEEASVAIRTVGGAALDYPIFIDVEYSGEYPDGRSDTLTGAQRAQIVTAFCETVRSSGYTAGVYSGQNFFKYSIDFASISQYSVWLASYTMNNRLPDFAGRYDIWQFTDRGNIRGITGGVDVNVIF